MTTKQDPTNSATQKGQLKKSKRIPTPIRLELTDHAELSSTADNEQRSMAFIALRRYNAGKELEAQQS